MKNLIILKLGGSIITDKSSAGLIVRTDVLDAAARAIAHLRAQKPDTQLILIHGGGGPAHHLADDYDLRSGTGNDIAKIAAAQKIQKINMQLTNAIAHDLSVMGISTQTLHTHRFVTQRSGAVAKLDITHIFRAFELGEVPILYGDMVPDTALGLSVCSGDTLAAYCTQHFPVTKVIFATDVDGICTRDPHTHDDTQTISHISVSEALNANYLDTSHNTDVTGGLRNKIAVFENLFTATHLQSITIFNGLTLKNWSYIFTRPNEVTRKTVVTK